MLLGPRHFQFNLNKISLPDLCKPMLTYRSCILLRVLPFQRMCKKKIELCQSYLKNPKESPILEASILYLSVYTTQVNFLLKLVQITMSLVEHKNK